MSVAKIITPMPQLLRESAGIYERYTVELARASDFLLRKHGKSMDRVAGFMLDNGSYPWDAVL